MEGILDRRDFLRAVVFGAGGEALHSLGLLSGHDTARRVWCPILMYHYIEEPPEDADRTRRDLTVSPLRFAEHLDQLLEEGFTTVSLRVLNSTLTENAELPEKPVIITFDDGYVNAFDNAYPLLSERGMTGTFFLITGFVGSPGYLSWEQAVEMAAAGMEIGSHSVSHPDLTSLDDTTLRKELTDSMGAIEDRLGIHIAELCYPLGRTSRRVQSAAATAGYTSAVTTRDGTVHAADRLLRLSRARVRGSYSAHSVSWLVNRQI